MGDKTGIEWAESTWNPIRGCSRISEGCKKCYAETVAARFSGEGQPYEGLINPNTGAWNGTVRFIEEKLDEPARKSKPRLIFVNSMSDLFHEALTDHQIERIHDAMRRAPHHRFQILTKRADRMRSYYQRHPLDAMRHLWLGVSVEHQRAADERIPELLAIKTRGVRWLSVEPMLGPIDLTKIARDYDGDTMYYNVLDGRWHPADNGFDPGWGEERIGWVVVGGESGVGARPMDPRWAISVRDQCGLAGVPFFFKQFGEWAPVEAICNNREPADVARELSGKRTTSQRLVMPNDDDVVVWRVGKRTAGRKLDGRTWDGMPPWGSDG